MPAESSAPMLTLRRAQVGDEGRELLGAEERVRARRGRGACRWRGRRAAAAGAEGVEDQGRERGGLGLDGGEEAVLGGEGAGEVRLGGAGLGAPAAEGGGGVEAEIGAQVVDEGGGVGGRRRPGRATCLSGSLCGRLPAARRA